MGGRLERTHDCVESGIVAQYGDAITVESFVHLTVVEAVQQAAVQDCLRATAQAAC